MLAMSCTIAAQPVSSDTAAPKANQLPLWEIGGLNLNISQQAYPGSDQQINRTFILPYVVYRGEHLRADRDATGLRAIKTPKYELDVSFFGSLGSGDTAIQARTGMPKLGTLIEFGPRLRLNLSDPSRDTRWGLDLPLRGVFDLSNNLNNSGLKFEPTLTLRGNLPADWRYNAGLGFVFADKKFADVLYGVNQSYVTAARQAFEAQSGFVSTKLSLSVNKRLSPDWRFFAFSRLESVAGAANEASPLVRQKVGTSIGFGIAYTWQRSQTSEAAN
jgi:outer membrane scaffolding protein for murein synthesis (MipA/OmpV family)